MKIKLLYLKSLSKLPRLFRLENRDEIYEDCLNGENKIKNQTFTFFVPNNE